MALVAEVLGEVFSELVVVGFESGDLSLRVNVGRGVVEGVPRHRCFAQIRVWA